MKQRGFTFWTDWVVLYPVRVIYCLVKILFIIFFSLIICGWPEFWDESPLVIKKPIELI